MPRQRRAQSARPWAGGWTHRPSLLLKYSSLAARAATQARRRLPGCGRIGRLSAQASALAAQAGHDAPLGARLARHDAAQLCMAEKQPSATATGDQLNAAQGAPLPTASASTVVSRTMPPLRTKRRDSLASSGPGRQASGRQLPIAGWRDASDRLQPCVPSPGTSAHTPPVQLCRRTRSGRSALVAGGKCPCGHSRRRQPAQKQRQPQFLHQTRSRVMPATRLLACCMVAALGKSSTCAMLPRWRRTSHGPLPGARWGQCRGRALHARLWWPRWTRARAPTTPTLRSCLATRSSAWPRRVLPACRTAPQPGLCFRPLYLCA